MSRNHDWNVSGSWQTRYSCGCMATSAHVIYRSLAFLIIIYVQGVSQQGVDAC